MLWVGVFFSKWEHSRCGRCLYLCQEREQLWFSTCLFNHFEMIMRELFIYSLMLSERLNRSRHCCGYVMKFAATGFTSDFRVGPLISVDT
jgi:hypothetical protein